MQVISMKRSSVSTGGAGRLSMQELRSQDLNKPGLHTPQTWVPDALLSLAEKSVKVVNAKM